MKGDKKNNMNNITVAQLIEILQKYDADAIVYVIGGEGEFGEFAELVLAKGQHYEVILED